MLEDCAIGTDATFSSHTDASLALYASILGQFNLVTGNPLCLQSPASDR